MTSQVAMDVIYKSVITAAELSAPVLITTVVVGIFINIIQSVTSIRDQSLTFIPKVVASMFVMGLTFPWCVEIMNGFFIEIFTNFGTLIR